MKALQVIEELKEHASVEKAEHLSRFFKTGPGEYGENDCFLGITVPNNRSIAKKHIDLPLSEVEILLQNRFHEVRLCGLLILVLNVRKKGTSSELKKELFEFYLQHATACNNWDLVDLSCMDLVGKYIIQSKKFDILYKLSKSENMWLRRIAIVSTLPLIKTNHFKTTFDLALEYRNDSEDLIHKATGWMLREIGKKEILKLTNFLTSYGKTLSSITFRYAIEKYPDVTRKNFLQWRKQT